MKLFNCLLPKYLNVRHSFILMGFISLVVILNSIYIPTKAWLSQQLIAYSWKAAVLNKTPLPPWPWADTTPIAKMNVTRLGKSIVLLKGTDPTTLAFSAGVMHQYATLTDNRPFVVAGHRDTHFNFLQQLQLHDVISVNDINGNINAYQVNDINIVDSDSTPLLLNESEPSLLLVTCYPFNAIRSGGSLRYVISAKRIEV